MTHSLEVLYEVAAAWLKRSLRAVVISVMRDGHLHLELSSTAGGRRYFGLLPASGGTPHDVQASKLKVRAKAVIDELVVKKPEDRLSCSAREKTGAMRHAFFGLVDWGKLQQRGMAAPFVPTIADAFDSRLYEVAGEPPPEEGEFDREAAAEAFKEWSSSGKDDDGTMQMLQAKGVAGKLWTGVRRRMSLN